MNDHERQAASPFRSPPTPKRLSDDDQKLLLSYPVHTVAEIRAYLKPAEGLDRIVPHVARFLGAHPEIAAALKVDEAKLSAETDEASRLDAPTAAAFGLYRRGYENSMELRSDVTRAIYKVNRFVQNALDEELAREFAEVSDWVSATHAHQGAPVVIPSAPADDVPHLAPDAAAGRKLA